MTWADISGEYERERIGPLILQAVRDAVDRAVKRYPPGIYSAGYGTWDSEAREDLVQEVVLKKLLEEHQLEYAMSMAGPDDFNRLLTHQVRRQLASRRQRSIIDNILDRCRPLLAASPFALAGSGTSASFRLIGHDVEERDPTEEEIRSASLRVAIVPRLRDPDADRASMVYSEENLKVLLLLIAESLPSSFKISHLDRILRKVLTSWLPSLLPTLDDEAMEITDTSAAPIDATAVVSASIESLVKRMTDEQSRLLGLKMAGASDGDIAKELGLSRPTVAKRKVEVLTLLSTEMADLAADQQVAAIDLLGMHLARRLTSES